MGTCRGCGADVRESAKFCELCGTPQGRSCVACGNELTSAARFCPECGTPQPEASTASSGDGPAVDAVARTTAPVEAGSDDPAAGPGTQVRLVSVLFVDLVAYTTLSESRDAEDVRELLSGYFDLARTVVDRYGGTISKFIGDAVMAVWGAPVAREDDAERAVRAALDLVAAVAAYGAEQEVPGFRLRGGVATGEAAAMASTLEGIVVGDRVNTAARIQALAPPGGVYVDEVTKQATSAAIAYEDAGEHVLKGKAEPVRVWQAERVVAGRGGANRFDGLEARYVGQTSQLELVKTLLHQTADERRARMALVSGTAGVGKSRLAWEFEKYVDGLSMSVRWHTGRCLSYGDGIAYWALAEIVRMRFSIGEAEPPDEAAAKLDDGLAEHLPDLAEREFVRPRLRQLLGLEEREGLGREELFSGWRLLFERLASDRPVVLVFEDLQWADEGLLDFVEHLLEWSASFPIFVLALGRPELLERRPDLAHHRNAVSLSLDPLSPTAMHELLDDLVPELPSELRERIADRAEGVPLYAVETIRMLIDRDIVAPRDGQYRLVGPVDELDVPPTLTSLIGARLDGLSPAERALVTDLSVLGDSFPRSAVQALTNLDEVTLDGMLTGLVRKEVLGVRNDPLSPERGHYRFLQSLVRKVAYETLSKRERKARHRAVANYLRDQFNDDVDEIVEIIANHYLEAYRAVPDDADSEDLRQLALDAYVRSARRADGLGARDAALRSYEVAVELSTDEQQQAELHHAAAQTALSAKDLERAVAHGQAAYDLHRAAGRTSAAAAASIRLCTGLARQDRLAEALVLAEQVYDTVADREDDPVLAEVCTRYGSLLLLTEATDRGRILLERALTLAQGLELYDVLARALDMYSYQLRLDGRHYEANVLQEAALTLTLEQETTLDAVQIYANLVDARCINDEPGAAELAEEGLALARRLGDRDATTNIVANLLLAHLFAGRWDEVETLAAEAPRDGDEPEGILMHRVALVRAYRGDLDGARDAFSYLERYRTSDDLQARTFVACAEGALALAAGQHGTALEVLVPSLHDSLAATGWRYELARQMWVDSFEAALGGERLDTAAELLEMLATPPRGVVPPYLRGQLVRCRALLGAARGEQHDVEEGLRSAARTFTELRYPFWRARAELDLAERLAGRGDQDAAAGPAATSLATFQQLRAQPWIARARTLVPDDAVVTV